MSFQFLFQSFELWKRNLLFKYMTKKIFIPFYAIKKHPNQVLVVDAHHPQGFDLSHWRGATVPKGCEADTSTEIVLKAIAHNIPELEMPYVTNNHYDIDGFLGVWYIFNPELAFTHKELLIEMAQIADFREVNKDNPEWKKAMKLVCLLNEAESEKFYPPFGAPEIAEKEMEACVPKYHYFLEAFAQYLQQPETVKATAEYEQILQEAENPIERKTISDIRMHIVQSEKPLHYYNLSAESHHADMVLSIYSGNRYELEYKYTTWVNTTRRHFPRISMEKLCDQLNEIEESGKKWEAEHFTDTAPILRLKGDKLSKKERFQSPCFRPIYASTIASEDFQAICTNYFRAYYKMLSVGESLDWKAVRKLNEKVFT